MTAVDDRSTEAEVPLSRRGRGRRVAIAVIGLLLITAGTVHGTDDDFPFGPLRMYSVRDDPNSEVTQAVVLATATDGRVVDVTNVSGAPRRAELEGRFDQLQHDPTAFDDLARHYVSASDRIRGHPNLVASEVRLVRRVYPLHDGRRSRASRDELIARWVPAG